MEADKDKKAKVLQEKLRQAKTVYGDAVEVYSKWELEAYGAMDKPLHELEALEIPQAVELGRNIKRQIKRRYRGRL